MTTSVLRRLGEGRVLFDGGMGSMLIARGLPAGWPPEEWNVSHAKDVLAVHDEYLNAGAEVVETNTFGATPVRLRKHGCDQRTAELNGAGVELARSAATKAIAASGQPRFVAFSMGPTGEMFPPVGNASDESVLDEFLAQLAGISDGNQPDLVLIETMLDVREALVGVAAVRRSLNLPIAVSMTYGRNPRGFYTVMGNEAGETTRALADAGVNVIAANCSIASGDMLHLARLLRKETELPILCQPNAGKPDVRDGRPVYGQEPSEFASDSAELFSIGVNAVGGCCGTNPEFTRLAAAAMG